MARDFYASGEILSSNNPTTSNTHHHHHHHQQQQQQHEMVHQIQGFVDTNPTHHHHHHHQVFSLNTNMGLIDFSKQQEQNHNNHQQHQIRMTSGLEETSGGGNLLLEDSSSSMRCSNGNLACEVNEERPPPPPTTRRPSQGLSLSLSSSNPTSISLQSFELRPQTQHNHVLTTRVVNGSPRQGYFGKPHQNLQHSQMMMTMMMMNNNNNNNTTDINTTSANHHHHHHHQQHQQNQFQILRSKYVVPTQEILNEFCSLGTKQSDEEIMMTRQKNQKGKQQQQQEQWDHSSNNNYNNNDGAEQHDESASTSSRKHVPPLHSLEFMELQKRKSKLLSMLDEIDRRYQQYRDQMRAAASAFEAAAGAGAAATYTALAAKAMSRHFRCLRDGVVCQIQATRKAMGEREDPVAPGMSRGETPRLRLLDQAFRQQKVYRQMGLVDAHPWRPQRGLPERAVSVLRAWLFEHFLHPYPSDVDKHILARQTGLSRSQVSNWFINARVRLWKPMIEEMYSEETRGEPNHENDNKEENAMVNPVLSDPKPEPNPVIRVEPEYLSSIITNPSSKTDPKTSQTHHLHGTTSYGSTFDFPLYGHQAVTYPGDNTSHGFDDGTRGVSLTLGLQRHDGNGGVSLAFSPAAQGTPLFYGRDHIEDCQQGSVQYSTSLLDGDHHQAQNLPYKNLMGAQLLHDIV